MAARSIVSLQEDKRTKQHQLLLLVSSLDDGEHIAKNYHHVARNVEKYLKKR